MIGHRPWLLVLFALLLSGGPLVAASREERDFAAATAAFQDNMWSRAEVAFAEFIKKHPKSGRIPEAVLMQAQADFNQGKLLQAISLLEAGELSAGSLADQYAYWIGYSQLSANDYEDAAKTFAQLAGTFTSSPWRLDAVVNEASARAKLGQWKQVDALLQKSEVFQAAAKTNATDSRVLNGRLLLAEAFMAENQPDAATALLQSSAAFKSQPDLDWRRLDLLCQAQLQMGNTNAALSVTTNLILAGRLANRADLSAQGVSEQADLLEKIGLLSAAASVYEENLATNAPDDWQRQAILRIADLSAAQTNFSDAENSLEDFQSRFPASREMDSVTLALGELYLKSYATRPSTNDDLAQAHTYFDEFIGTFTNSPLLGKAYLDRGWCFWIENKWPESAADFQAAVQNLPMSVDLAVAHFKLGDADFKQNQLVDARDNYQVVVNNFTNFPIVNRALGAQALYQTLRVCLQLQDYSGASNSLAQILKIYPVSTVAEKGVLLEGEALSDLKQPERARALFQKFEQVFPNSEQLPDVELAIARTYEQENNWPLAISVYDSWVTRFAGNPNLPAVEYARGWANFEGGHETNAFMLFTNFLAEYPSNAMTPVVQWWMGDFYYGQGDWVNAEKNYELVFDNWSSNSLAYPAQLMAGRAAMGRQGFNDAKAYFVNLAGDTNCPPQLAVQAWFALGDVYMQEPSPDINTPLTNFWQAISYFQIVCQDYPDSEQAALASGEIGDCYLQLASQSPQYYSYATNAYVQVMASPGAAISERSQAQVGIGMVYEKLAALTNGVSQTTLQQAALDNYLDVFFGNNLRDGEPADPFWIKQAGLHALPLIETFGTGDPNKFINQMEAALPQLKDFLEKKRLQISRPKNE